MSWWIGYIKALALIVVFSCLFVGTIAILSNPNFHFSEAKITDISSNGRVALLDNGVKADMWKCEFAKVGDTIEYGYAFPVVTPIAICKGAIP